MVVSENGGTPKSSILIGISIINHPFWGTPIFLETPIYLGKPWEMIQFDRRMRCWSQSLTGMNTWFPTKESPLFCMVDFIYLYVIPCWFFQGCKIEKRCLLLIIYLLQPELGAKNLGASIPIIFWFPVRRWTWFEAGDCQPVSFWFNKSDQLPSLKLFEHSWTIFKQKFQTNPSDHMKTLSESDFCMTEISHIICLVWSLESVNGW